ncbi:Uncharacterised protein [Mycobacterium tuberculosis]|nr:Uncharacterised protein [Mycobacterium tuberculosis]
MYILRNQRLSQQVIDHGLIACACVFRALTCGFDYGIV